MGAALPPAAALAVPLLFWDAWRLLAGRFGDGLSSVPLLLVGLAAAAPAVRRIAEGKPEPVPLAWASGLLAAYAAASALAPTIVGISVAVAATILLCRRVAGAAAPAAPFVGLALLVLPVLPSLEFFLAYPLRVVGAFLAAALLRLNGIAVEVDGVALSWNGQPFLFDAACSGIRMLWASLFLVSAAGAAAGFAPLRYARALAIACAVAIGGNAVRATSLFYVENGFVDALRGPVWHEAIGLLTFGMLALLILALVVPRRRSAA